MRSAWLWYSVNTVRPAIAVGLDGELILSEPGADRLIMLHFMGAAFWVLQLTAYGIALMFRTVF